MSTSTRLSRRLEALRDEDRKAMGIFLTCGFPSIGLTLPVLRAVDRGGADFIELGMPFSDPLAEGVPIQRSSAAALAGGTTLKTVLGVADAFRKESETPLLLMGYINPIHRFGVARFCRAAASAGVDGLIVPDLPFESSDMLRSDAMAAGLDTVFLIAPNTSPDRIRSIDRVSSGFVYAVAFAGLTGDTIDTGDPFQAYIESARRSVSNPLMVGFGIKSAADARRACRHSDGFIVGSALTVLIEEVWRDADLSAEDRLEHVERFVRELRPRGD